MEKQESEDYSENHLPSNASEDSSTHEEDNRKCEKDQENNARATAEDNAPKEPAVAKRPQRTRRPPAWTQDFHLNTDIIDL